jgi:hypothetical protein
MPVKTSDAFVIVCTITSSPAKPPAYTIPRQPVPRALLDTVGSLLDDPLYSDVQFIIPKRGQSISNGWKIWASKKLLKRADYFQTSRQSALTFNSSNKLKNIDFAVFSSNFAEGAMDPKDIDQTPRTMTRDIKKSPPQLNILLDEFEDSDNEFDDGDHPDAMAIDSLGSSTNGHEEDSMLMLDSHTGDWEGLDAEGVQSTDSHVSSTEIAPSTNVQEPIASTDSSKLTIVVKDAAYTTYRAMLYYVSQQNDTSPKNH